jgi:hypothetical protein
MITSIRRAATAVAAVAALAAGGVGIASAGIALAPAASAAEITAPAHTDWSPFCLFDGNFNWHYYNWCDSNYWHGGHDRDWRDFHDRHHDYDFGWHR